jgi:hypothetical protein
MLCDRPVGLVAAGDFGMHAAHDQSQYIFVLMLCIAFIV